MKSNKGFTLIELLVVIAIIGILSSVVLASLTTARSKGTDASIQNQLSNMRAQAELYYSSNTNSYGSATNCNEGMFASTTTNGLGKFVTGITSAYSSANVTCGSTATTWYTTAKLMDGRTWCVDSNGKSASTTASGGVCL